MFTNHTFWLIIFGLRYSFLLDTGAKQWLLALEKLQDKTSTPKRMLDNYIDLARAKAETSVYILINSNS